MTKSGILLTVVFILLFLGIPAVADDENEWSHIVRTRWADPNSHPQTYEEYLELYPQDKPFSIESITTYAGDNSGRSGLRHGGGEGLLLVIVNTTLKPLIQASIDQYAADVTEEGYTVAVVSTEGGTPGDIRATLAGYLGSNLMGALLIGKLPVPWYEVSGESFPCDLFYMDLDGDWTDTDSNGVYDLHQNNETPEIFMGRLTAGPLQGYGHGSEENKVNNYFAKAHDYRTGLLTANYRALSYPDDDWAYFNKCNLNELYDDVTVVNDTIQTSADDYKIRIV